MDFLKNAASQAMSGNQQQSSQNSNSNYGSNEGQNAQQGGFGGGQMSQGGQQQQGNMVQEQQQMGQSQSQSQSGGGGGFMDKLQNMGNNALGGGQAGEAKEDGLDKAYDYIQENYMGKGPQNNESAAEQAQDEMITDQIRGAYKSATGKEFFIADKN